MTLDLFIYFCFNLVLNPWLWSKW